MPGARAQPLNRATRAGRCPLPRHGQFRAHRPRADTVGADAPFARFRRLLPGQVNDRRLRRAIGHPQGGRAQAGNRPDVDNRPLTGAQGGTAGLRHQKHPVRIDRHHRAPTGKVMVGDRPEIRNTGSVDLRIGPPEIDQHPRPLPPLLPAPGHPGRSSQPANRLRQTAARWPARCPARHR